MICSGIHASCSWNYIYEWVDITLGHLTQVEGMRRNAKLQPLVTFHGSNVQSKRCPCTYPCWSFKKLRVIRTMQFKDKILKYLEIAFAKWKEPSQKGRGHPHVLEVPKSQRWDSCKPLQKYHKYHSLSYWWRPFWARNATKVSIYPSFLSMKLIRLILDQTNKNLCFTKTSSSSCRGVGAAKSTSPSWSSTCRNRQQDQARLTCSAMIFLGIYDIYVQQNIGSNSMQILLVAECGAHSWRVSHQTMAA